MKNDIKVLLGGVGVLIAAFPLLTACANEPAPARAPEPAAEPLAPPRLEPELTTTAPSAVVSEGVDAPESAGEPYEPELRDGAVRLRRLIVATGVADREPTGASDVFEVGASPRLYAFLEAVNETDEPVALRVTFEPEHGERVGHVSLTVPANAPRYRTWAYTRHVYTSGRWHVVVRDAEGRVIASRPFDVE